MTDSENSEPNETKRYQDLSSTPEEIGNYELYFIAFDRVNILFDILNIVYAFKYKLANFRIFSVNCITIVLATLAFHDNWLFSNK